MTDELLMAKVRDGDLAPLGVLFERYHLRLFDFLSRVTGDRVEAQDLVQDVFVRVLKYRSTAFNGNIDVTLPSTVKANLKIRTDNGSVFTDFDWQRQPAVPSLLQSQQPRTTVIGELISAAINGGGPDVEIRVFNGNVYLRKGKR